MQLYTPKDGDLVRVDRLSQYAYYRVVSVEDKGIEYSVKIEWAQGNWEPVKMLGLKVSKIDCVTFAGFKESLGKKILQNV